MLPLGQLAAVRTGQEVIAIGSALGPQNTVTRGIVSARRQAGSVVLLQTDAAINPGNSGGAAAQIAQGVILGVTTLKMGGPAEGLGFAIAADHVTALVESRLHGDDRRRRRRRRSRRGLPSAGPGALPGFGDPGRRGRRQSAHRRGAQAFERSTSVAAPSARPMSTATGSRFTTACAPRPRRTRAIASGSGWARAGSSFPPATELPLLAERHDLDEPRVRRGDAEGRRGGAARQASTRARCARPGGSIV